MKKTNHNQSWGDMIRSIDTERKTLPWDAHEVSRPHTVTLAERKLSERDVDLIAMVYRDPIREKLHTSSQLEADSSLISKRSEMIEKNFNIINHRGSSRISSDQNISLTNERKKKIITRDWHILSNLITNDHLNVPIQYEEDNRLEQQKRYSLPIKERKEIERDFSIVSGKFKENNDLKEEKIAFDIRKKCDEMFSKTNTYDFIKGKSHNPKNQEKFERRYISLEKMQGVAQAKKFPYSVSHSEGKTYDILNHNLLDKDKLERGPLFKEIRAFNRIKKINYDNNMHISGDYKAMILEEKSIQKFKYKRFQNEHNRDYDMLSNNLFPERNVLYSNKASSSRLMSPWDKLKLKDDNFVFNDKSDKIINDNNNNNNNNNFNINNNHNNSNISSNNNHNDNDNNHDNRVISEKNFLKNKIIDSKYVFNPTIVANNYMGNHEGTGMNVHRAFTSYPCLRKIHGNIVDMSPAINVVNEQRSSNFIVSERSNYIKNNNQDIENDIGNNENALHNNQDNNCDKNSVTSNDNNNNNNTNNNSNDINNNDNNNNHNNNSEHNNHTNLYSDVNNLLRGTNSIDDNINKKTNNMESQRIPITTRPRVIPALHMSKLPAAVPYVYQISVRTGGLSGL